MFRRDFLIGAGAAIVSQSWSHAFAQRVDKYAEQLKNGEFNWFPERSRAGPDPDHRVDPGAAGACLS